MGGNVQRDGDDGFTMVELMVVVLVIGLLIAIAVPIFLGARNRAHNRAAQSDLRSALVGAKAIFASNGSFSCARTTNGTVAPASGSACRRRRAHSSIWPQAPLRRSPRHG
jgi:prepilin-type N-terminal cleavage/methylation domain-containing protein